MNASGSQREFIHIGRINAPHGIKGEVRVLPLTEDPDRFRELKNCLLISPDEKTRSEVVVRSVREADRTLLVKIGRAHV